MLFHNIPLFKNASRFICRRPPLNIDYPKSIGRDTAWRWFGFHGVCYTMLILLCLHQSVSGDSKTMTVGGTTNVSTAANQACSTTCSAGCMVGLDIGILGVALPHLVACDNATADECLCAN